MKVILKQDIKGLGKKGDIVDTSDGYARNYLIPRGMVVEATQGNITKAKEQKKAQEIREQRERQEAQALAEKISQATLLLKAKAAEDGRLYGSVTSKDISQALEEQKKIKVDKRKINLAEPIRYIGEIQVEIKILPGIIGNLRVKVERE
jgi:large subunit ribosomal protein L9